MEIKTIRANVDHYDYFDEEVNKALSEGWFLNKRYVVSGLEHNRLCLIAEMTRGIPESKIKIPVKYFDNQIILLEKITVGDWIDLRCAETVTLKAGEYKLLRLGVGMILPDGYEAHILPRSSAPDKFGIMCANSQGVIDNSYSGDADEWKFPAVAIRDTTINKNDRIAQFRIIKNQPRIEFETVTHLHNDSRGGIGSTGTR